MADDITTSGTGSGGGNRGRTDETARCGALRQPVERAVEITVGALMRQGDVMTMAALMRHPVGDGDNRGRTDETASGTNGRVSSSGHTRGGSRYAETPNGAANDWGRAEAESDSEREEVQHKSRKRKKEHG